jgi:transposase
MPQKRRKFSPEFKDDAVKMVVMNSQPIARVARELDLHEGTLGKWVTEYRRNHAGEEPALDLNERARLREAERLVRELKMENEFLKKVIMSAGAGTVTG